MAQRKPEWTGVAKAFYSGAVVIGERDLGMKVGSTPRTSGDLEPGSRVGQWVENS